MKKSRESMPIININRKKGKRGQNKNEGEEEKGCDLYAVSMYDFIKSVYAVLLENDKERDERE